ncbi:MAG: prealbumin-like fold domain-containing protein, partial [Clostridiales bacterium]|nr:prealbumin-like fold domain-containing protein [Clostridiales bacterium]
PTGVELESISVKIFNGSTAAVTYQNGAWSSNSNYVTPDVTDNNNGQIVTLTFAEDFYKSLEQQTDGGYIYITYTCKITDSVMSALLSADGSEQSFANRVTATYTGEGGSIVDSGEDTQTQTVTYKEPAASAVDKSYYWDNNNDRLTYYVLLNSDEEDLLADSDELTFTDTLWTNDVWSGVIPSLYFNSVTFYTLTELNGSWSDVVETDNIIVSGIYTYTDSDGNEQSVNYLAGSLSDLYVTSLTVSDNWSSADVYLKTAVDIVWTYSEEIDSSGSTSHIITATVPDSTRLLVEYAYQITIDSVYNQNPSDPYYMNIYNTAELSGSVSDSVIGHEAYTEVSSGGGASYRQHFTLTKVDVNNYGTTLAGATYSLYMYDGAEWVNTGGTYTTDANGQISFSFSDSGIADITYEYNTAYYLVESSAPEGYLLDSTTKYYFYWSNSDTTTHSEKYPDNWSNLTTYNLTTASHSVAATNTPVSTTSVAVKKAWVDENGNDITSTITSPDSVTFKLYRYTVSSSSSEDSGGSSDDTVTVYWNNGGSQFDATAYTAIGKVTKGEDAKINLSYDQYTWWGGWCVYIGDLASWNFTTYGDWNTIDYDLTSSEYTISAEYVTRDIYIYSYSITNVSIDTPKGNLTIIKTFEDEPDTLDIDGVTFTVTDSEGNEVSGSPITYSQMQSGTYTVSRHPGGTDTLTASHADVSGG